MSTAYVEGLSELKRDIGTLRKLLAPADELLARPWKQAMETLAEAGQSAAQGAAPTGQTGQLRQRTFARVQKKGFPMWAAVRSRAKRKSKKYPGGYPYPRMLEYSAKHGHQGWFTRSIEAQWGQKAESALARAGDAMARAWGQK